MRKATKNEFHFDILMESSIKTIANLCCDNRCLLWEANKQRELSGIKYNENRYRITVY